MSDFFAVEMMQTIITGVVIFALGLPFAIAIARRISPRKEATAALPGNSAELLRSMESRLTRIESAVESIAVEVERVTEGQRFTVKLLSAPKRGDAPPLGAP